MTRHVESPVPGTQRHLSGSGSLGPTSGPPRGHSAFWSSEEVSQSYAAEKAIFFFFAVAMWIDF